MRVLGGGMIASINPYRGYNINFQYTQISPSVFASKGAITPFLSKIDTCHFNVQVIVHHFYTSKLSEY